MRYWQPILKNFVHNRKYMKTILLSKLKKTKQNKNVDRLSWLNSITAMGFSWVWYWYIKGIFRDPGPNHTFLSTFWYHCIVRKNSPMLTTLSFHKNSTGTVQFWQNREILHFFWIFDAWASEITVQYSMEKLFRISHQCKIIANWNFEHRLFKWASINRCHRKGCFSHPEMSEYCFKQVKLLSNMALNLLHQDWIDRPICPSHYFGDHPGDTLKYPEITNSCTPHKGIIGIDWKFGNELVLITSTELCHKKNVRTAKWTFKI